MHGGAKTHARTFARTEPHDAAAAAAAARTQLISIPLGKLPVWQGSSYEPNAIDGDDDDDDDLDDPCSCGFTHTHTHTYYARIYLLKYAPHEHWHINKSNYWMFEQSRQRSNAIWQFIMYFPGGLSPRTERIGLGCTRPGVVRPHTHAHTHGRMSELASGTEVHRGALWWNIVRRPAHRSPPCIRLLAQLWARFKVYRSPQSVRPCLHARECVFSHF